MLWTVRAAITLWLTPVFAAGVHVFGPSAPGAIVVGTALGLTVAGATGRRLTDTLAPALRHNAVAALVALAAVAAIGQIARASVYIADPAQAKWAYHASDPFRVRHSCMTAYVEAVRFCRQPDTNIYRMELYEPGPPRFIGPLKVDSFHYPPPFLLLPAAIEAIAPDVFAFRGVWFVMQCVVLAAVIFGLSSWVGGDAGARAAAGGVLAFATPQFVFALQQGNVQTTAVAVATLALVLLWGRRFAIGAVLLAYVAAAKIFPGILIVYLAAARRWKALAATAAAGAAIVALALIVVGSRPFDDFLRYELPRISSGEAFPHTETIGYGVNFTVYGVTVRWRKLGVEWLTRPRGLAIASAYGIGVILFAALAGWRGRPDLESPPGRLRFVQGALALVVLASMRSPFMPVYGLVAIIWLITLLAAERRSWAAVAAVWGAVAVMVGGYTWMPSAGVLPRLPHMVAADVLTLAALVMCLGIVVRGLLPMPARVAAPRSAVT